MFEVLVAQPFETEVEEAVRHAGFIEAQRVFDRQALEAEATELLANHDQLSVPEVRRPEREDNARTALMEALTASGHLSRVELVGTLEEIYDQMIARLVKGWRHDLPEHEKSRRFAELCNVLFNRNVHKDMAAGILPANTAILEISDYPEPLIGTDLGYRDSNKKGMIRSTHLQSRDNGQYAVIIEQVSRSNGTFGSTGAFFTACGITLDPYTSPDVAALSTPLVYSTYDHADGVVDVARLLDTHQGGNALYGDTGDARMKHVSYQELREESATRESQLELYIAKLADLEEQLDGYVAKRAITYEERMNIFKGEVRRILQAICRLAPEYAEATFGAPAAPVYRQAAMLEAQGRRAEADALLAKNQHLEGAVTFCGVTMSVEQAKQAGLKVNSVGELVNEGKSNWKWKMGVCQVKTCSSRPKKTEVGPCSVCRNCQRKFDRGLDPTKEILSLIMRKRDNHAKPQPRRPRRV